MVSAAAALVPLVQTVAMALTSSSSSPPPSAEGISGGVGRTFHYVPYGSKTFDPSVSFPNRPWIACDGRVESIAASSTTSTAEESSSTGMTKSNEESLELSHWNGNTTPDIYYADTSTEMALHLPLDVYQNAVVVNNHYDSDGILSVFCCLQPTLARQHANLIISAAEAGDFGEWTSNGGVVLNGCLEWYGTISNKNEEAAYQQALDDLPQLLHEIDRRMTKSDGALSLSTLSDNVELAEVLQAGQDVLDEAQRDYKCLLDGTTFRVVKGPGSIVLVEEPSLQKLSSFALHKYLTTMNWLSCNRLLRYSIVSTLQDGDVDASTLDEMDDTGDNENEFESFSTYSYVYEKPGHGWVHKLRDRRPIPDIVNINELVDKLNTIYDGEWQTGGPSSGLVAICRTKVPMQPSQDYGLDDSPDEVAALLLDLDAGAR